MCHLRPPRVFLRGGFSSSANFDTPNEVCVFGGGGVRGDRGQLYLIVSEKSQYAFISAFIRQ